MFDSNQVITERIKSIDASGIRKVFDLAAKIKNPINLSIGQPDFDVPQSIREAAAEAMRQGHNKYTLTQGIAELRASVEERFKAAYVHDGRWSKFSTLITSGVSGGLMLALLTCAEAGDEVLVPDPYFVMYKHLVTLAGAKAVYVDTYPDFQMSAAKVEKLITPRTRMLILASPSNPTGVVTSPRELEKLVRLCEERNILLLSDEIYDEFCYEKVQTPEGLRAPSAASYGDNVLVMRGYSKTYAMTGWRLGWVTGPSAIVDQMTKLQQYTFVCAPSMVQFGGVAAADVDMSDHVQAYRGKRDMVVEKLSKYFELTVPGGAFYAFPKVPTGETATKFVERAIARDLLVIPGCVFSERDTHLRLSYACEDRMLERGLDILVELAKG